MATLKMIELTTRTTWTTTAIDSGERGKKRNSLRRRDIGRKKECAAGLGGARSVRGPSKSLGRAFVTTTHE